MMSIEYRSVRPEDVPGVFFVRTSVTHNHMSEDELAGIGITRASFADSLNDGSAGAWCAISNEQLIGFSYAFKGSRAVSALFVLPDFEEMGIGGRLLDLAVIWLRGHSGEMVRLCTDPATPAYDFYVRRGWRDLGRRKDLDSNDVWLELDPSMLEGEG